MTTTEQLAEGDRVLVQATVIRATPGVGVLVELFSKTDQYEAWVRWGHVTLAKEFHPVEPPDGTLLIVDPDGGERYGTVFRRDDAEGHFDPGRRHDRHWWDYSAGEWIDWPTAVRRGADPDLRLTVLAKEQT